MINVQVVFVDSNRRAHFVQARPEGGYGVYTQPVDGSQGPRRLTSRAYINADGYPTFEDTQKALDLYISNVRNTGTFHRLDTLVNGKVVSDNDYYAMCRGELAVPTPVDEVRLTTLKDIEHQIAHHMRGAYSEMLEVGRCLNEAKETELVPHGQWEEWVRRNTGMSERQAQKLMQAARSVGPNSAMARLPISKIQAILSLPEPEREGMAERAEGENLSLRELQKEVDQAKKELAEAKRGNGDLRDAYARKSEEAKKLQEKLASAEGRPGNGFSPDAQKRINELAEAERKAKEEFQAISKVLEANTRSAAQAAQAALQEKERADKLAKELANAEAFLEQREAEHLDLLAKSQAPQSAVRDVPSGLTAFELAAAVRTFIGTAGVLPHMGALFAGASRAERQAFTQYVDMIDTWVAGARQALSSTFEGEWGEAQ